MAEKKDVNKREAKKKINGTEYTFRKLPVKAAFDLRNKWMDKQFGIDQEEMYPLVLEHLVIHPNVSIDDFEEMWELDEVVNHAIDFQYGKGKN